MIHSRIKLFILSLALVFGIALPAVPALAATDVFQGACSAKGADASAACEANGSDPLTGSSGLLVKVTRLISYVAGAASIILIVTAGLMYVLSNGDSSRINAAKTTIIYAVVGLVIVGVAQGIVVLVLNVL